MTGSRLLLHVGYHKTATTWMQRSLFTPEHGYRQVAGHQEAFDLVVRPSGLHFDPGPMRELLAAAAARLDPAETPVLSSEVLSGHPFRGANVADVYAERLSRIAPDARILITIRGQLAILPSVYMQYVLRGGTMPPGPFFDGAEEVGYFGFKPEHFEYDLLTARYQALFGPENVYVMTQESLRADLDGAVARLAAFAGNDAPQRLGDAARAPQGASYPEHAVPVLRRINHLQRSVLNPSPPVALGTTPGGLFKVAGYLLKRSAVARLLGGRKPVTELVARRFAGRYTDSNRRLAELCVHLIDLSRYP